MYGDINIWLTPLITFVQKLVVGGSDKCRITFLSSSLTTHKDWYLQTVLFYLTCYYWCVTFQILSVIWIGMLASLCHSRAFVLFMFYDVCSCSLTKVTSGCKADIYDMCFSCVWITLLNCLVQCETLHTSVVANPYNLIKCLKDAADLFVVVLQLIFV